MTLSAGCEAWTGAGRAAPLRPSGDPRTTREPLARRAATATGGLETKKTWGEILMLARHDGHLRVGEQLPKARPVASNKEVEMDTRPILSVRIAAVAGGIAALVVLDNRGASAQICGGPACVSSADIVDGQVQASDLAGGSVTTSKLQAGAVTGAKVQDESLSEADFFVAQRVMVATKGGDFTSVGAALAAISPSGANPYVVAVMPGLYVENVTMKSFVHLQGAGREVVTLRAADPGLPVITMTSLTNAAVTGLTITNGKSGILNSFSGFFVTISDNRISANLEPGIDNRSSAPLIRDNLVTGNGGFGFDLTGSSAPIIRDNTITDNGGAGIGDFSGATILGNLIRENEYGIAQSCGCSPLIADNVITSNGPLDGIFVENGAKPTISGNSITLSKRNGIRVVSSAAPTILHNRIASNGAAGATDLFVDRSSVPNISLNLYDDISGTTGNGQFNVNSAGNPAPAP
jgi:parallel beta-helix repeat protein